MADACARLAGRVDPRTAAEVDRVARRLAAPLQVAVAGRISSGKSTLVNALIGRRVAPTGAGECTRLVTRFSYGTVDRVEVVLRDGARRALPFEPDGTLPRDVAARAGVPLAAVSHLEAYLTSALLADLTVVDTPGLGSLDDASRERAEAVLGPQGLDDVSAAAVTVAEAVLYVVTQTVRADDAAALGTSEYLRATAARAAGPANAVAVLNKVDTIPPESVAGSDGDVQRAGALLAQRQAATLRPRVADVLPAIGLLAETAETGLFTAADADALRALAATDAGTREAMLLSADLFTSLDAPVPPATRSRLLDRLDLHGVRVALDLLDAAPELTAGALRRALLDASGLAAVRARLDAVLLARADAIKAAAAITSLTALAPDRPAVRDAVEELLARPEAHQLRLLDALTRVTAGEVALPDDLADELLRLAGSADPAEQLGRPGASRTELAALALERAGAWRSLAYAASPGRARVAHVVHRAYFLLWQSLR